MSKTLKILLIVLGAIVFLFVIPLGCSIVKFKNNAVDKSELIDGSWAEVETQYQRRVDLIPNLVNTVKGYADFEQETLTAVIEARAKATSVSINPENLSPDAIAQFEQAQQGVSSALSRLLVTVERYPDLKASTQFSQLQVQLEGTENRIAVARRNFNQSVRDYNAYIKKIPNSLWASIWNYEESGYFESKPGSDVAPEVTFD
tara:strand:- start:439 stop:1047 length:609 start_codon:yes stop_codon:yes gene_type:complete